MCCPVCIDFSNDSKWFWICGLLPKHIYYQHKYLHLFFFISWQAYMRKIMLLNWTYLISGSCLCLKCEFNSVLAFFTLSNNNKNRSRLSLESLRIWLNSMQKAQAFIINQLLTVTKRNFYWAGYKITSHFTQMAPILILNPNLTLLVYM